jgi:hypothetical protein
MKKIDVECIVLLVQCHVPWVLILTCFDHSIMKYYEKLLAHNGFL